MNKSLLVCTLATAALVLTALPGCKMSVNKNEKGEDARVNIQTPMGSLKVDTTEASARDTGLPVYPNAKEKNDGDKDKARVNIDTSFFGMKVVAMSYTSADAPDKVLAFYRDKMKSMGNYIECKGEYSEGGHTKGGGDRPVSCGKKDGNSDEVTLKIGTEDNQRIVAVKPVSGGSEFALVYLRIHGDKDGKDPI